MIELTGKPACKLKLVDGPGQAIRRGGGLLTQRGGIGIVAHLVGKLQRRAGIGKIAACGIHGGDVFLGACNLLHRGTSGFGVIPKPRGDAFGLELGYTGALFIQMEICLDLAEPVRKCVQLGNRHLRSFGH